MNRSVNGTFLPSLAHLYLLFKAQLTVCLVRLCWQLMFLAYLFFLVWLGVTAFTSLPVFMYFNVWSMCKNSSLVEGANLCLDLRQFGTYPDIVGYLSNGWVLYLIACTTFLKLIKVVLMVHPGYESTHSALKAWRGRRNAHWQQLGEVGENIQNLTISLILWEFFLLISVLSL